MNTMIEYLGHEIARQRHQELLASADRYRRGRSAREPNTRPGAVAHCLKLLPGRSADSRARSAARPAAEPSLADSGAGDGIARRQQIEMLR
jgi:hypothetical protein